MSTWIFLKLCGGGKVELDIVIHTEASKDDWGVMSQPQARGLDPGGYHMRHKSTSIA
jgi:hypothetical protein